MDPSFLKLIALLIFLAALRHLGILCYQKGKAMHNWKLGLCFMTVVVSATVWAVWFLGLRA